MPRSGHPTFREDRACLAPKCFRGLEHALTCRCGREQRAVLRQQLALDKRNRLAELGHLGFGNDGAGPGRRQEIHGNADRTRIEPAIELAGDRMWIDR